MRNGDRTMTAARAEALERLAVLCSFWGGGIGIAVLKAIAYMASGSALVRATMFESIGDVISSAIMAITQKQKLDVHNRHRYPMGKSRFIPLGVLFFSAFLCSAMTGIVIQALQALICQEEEVDEVAAMAAEAALRRLFAEKPRLEWAYGPGSAEGMINEYRSAPIEVLGAGIDDLTSRLLAVCMIVKIILFLICSYVQKLRHCEIVNALKFDHRNDAVSNAIVIFVTAILARASKAEKPWPYLAKVDPAASMLLASWIVYGWGCTALEQLAVLSDSRAPPGQERVIGEAAQRALSGTPLQLRGADVYHAGEGLRVRIDIVPVAGNGGAEAVSNALEALDLAVRAASGEVLEVDTQLRPSSSRTAESLSWVGEYSGKTPEP